MISSKTQLADFLKLDFLKMVYPTPPTGVGPESVVEIGSTYSSTCVRKAAEALSDHELFEVLQFKELISHHNNAKNGRESNGVNWTIQEILENNGGVWKNKIATCLIEINREQEREKRRNNLLAIEKLLRLKEFSKSNPASSRNSSDSESVAEIIGTYTWTCVINAAQALNDEEFLKLKEYKSEISFHNNQSGHRGVGATWTIWYFLDYNGGTVLGERIKRLS